MPRRGAIGRVIKGRKYPAWSNFIASLPQEGDGKGGVLLLFGQPCVELCLVGRVGIGAEFMRGDSRREPGVVPTDGTFRSSHWDQPNVLAHVRFNERTDADGKRVLFIEEIQSDFGQATRKSKLQVVQQVKADFEGIVDRMKAAGVLAVECD